MAWGKKVRSSELNANIAEELICGPPRDMKRYSMREDTSALAACALTCFGGSKSRECACATPAECMIRGEGRFESAKRRETFDDD